MTLSNPSGASMHDERMEELAAGYALGSLSVDDLGVFEAHRQQCQLCAALVNDFSAIVTILPDSIGEVEPSTSLKSRIFAEIERERLSIEPPPPLILEEHRRSRRNLWSLAAAAMLLISTGLGLWNVRLQQDLQVAQSREQLQSEVVAALAAGGETRQLNGTESAPDARAVVIADPHGQNPMLVVGSLPSLPPGQVYQAWVVGPSGPVDAGVFAPDQSSGSVIRLTHRPQGSETVALTIEPNGGSPAPTGPIVVAGVV